MLPASDKSLPKCKAKRAATAAALAAVLLPLACASKSDCSNRSSFNLVNGTLSFDVLLFHVICFQFAHRRFEQLADLAQVAFTVLEPANLSLEPQLLIAEVGQFLRHLHAVIFAMSFCARDSD